MQKAIIFDLDGVLADSSTRFKRLDLQAFDNKDVEAFKQSVILYNLDCYNDCCKYKRNRLSCKI